MNPIYLDLPEDELTLPEETTVLEDGAVGYYQRNMNDCLRAAIATAVQIPYEDVPDTEPTGAGGQGEWLQVYSRLWEWAAGQGIRLEFHTFPPICEAPWVGVTPRGDDGYRHTIVIANGQLYFDPASGFETPDGTQIATTREVEYGITFTRKEES